METITISLWYIFIAFFAFVGILVYLFMFKLATGKYGSERFKAFLPWNKGRGIWIRYHNRSGKEYDRYIKAPLSGNFYEFSEKQKVYLEMCYNQLFDDTGTLLPSKESAYGIPLYHIFENSPTNVLPIYRNFEQDINYFKDTIKLINTVIRSNDDVAIADLRQKIFDRIFALKEEFKYLPDAKKICVSLINVPITQIAENGKVTVLNQSEILKQYKLHLESLTRVLSLKDKSLVNFSDFFNQSNLSGLISNLVSLVYTTGFLDAMTSVKKEKFWNWILIIIMVLGFIIVGAITIQQNKKIDAIGNMVGQINADMNIIRPLIVDSGGLTPPEFINVIDGNVTNKPVI